MIWEILQDGDVLIRCAESPPRCRVEATLDAPAADVEAMLKDFERYPDIFPRMTDADVRGDVAWLRLDLPGVLADRDYVVRYEERREGKAWVVQFAAVVDARFPPLPDAVRLGDMYGEWRVEATPEGDARVVYEWNPDLGGGVPEWAWERARRMQGNEVMASLVDALAR